MCPRFSFHFPIIRDFVDFAARPIMINEYPAALSPLFESAWIATFRALQWRVCSTPDLPCLIYRE
ncbi:MAG: hypothetical protein LBB76_00185 [Azoarcus sp.]|jgi:hypothetical protein|nr:hypothetical protein [Azoarcus sp.]